MGIDIGDGVARLYEEKVQSCGNLSSVKLVDAHLGEQPRRRGTTLPDTGNQSVYR